MADAHRTGLDRAGLAVCLLAGVAVATTLGVVGAQQGQPRLLPVWWFTSMQSMKAWLSSAVLLMIVAQVLTASWMYGRLPLVRRAPAWVGPIHRVNGVLAFLLSLPVAYYCVYAFGFDTLTPRTTLHSVAGCVFYGAFASKMIGLRMARLPGWLIPVLGGTLFTAFVVAWYLSSWWWFQLVGYGR
ncbi:DUF6529 family protein [Nocardioides antri]|uniref:Cytochrome b561 domain-containing protein n=1 Tax=Nocardioides antri TaxID=2607659 RepID=A0A5B1M818_9ACTN|nr:DUF6529 family protein [Nocardioides antri]KAA1428668.1 hypothetical protein F0U47_00120 [Nocardioides antri]